MKVVLDTTVLIDVIRGNEKAIQTLEELRKTGVMHTTAVNVYEVLRGIKRMEKNQEVHMNALRLLLNNLYVLPFNLEAAEITAQIYANLARKGFFIDEADYMIAGCCLGNGIGAIVTRNEKHFGKISDLKVITY